MVRETHNFVVERISVDCDEERDENSDNQADYDADDELRQNFDAKRFSELTANAVEAFVDCETFAHLVENCHTNVAEIHNHVYENCQQNSKDSADERDESKRDCQREDDYADD